MFSTAALGVGITGVAVAALWLAALRLVSPIAPRGLDRGLACTVVVASAMVAQALTLGLIDLGTSPVALMLASLLMLAAARLALPVPQARQRDEVAAALRSLTDNERIAAGATAGLALAMGIYALFAPSLDLDSTFIHLPQVAGWVDNGTPGSQEIVTLAFPVESYPLTNETLLAWLGGASHNIGVLLLWPVVAILLLGGSLAHGLRAVGCDRRLALLAVGALLLTPLALDGLTSLDTDLASVSWIAVCGALSARVATGRSSPDLLAIAVLAFALGVGTKTSVAPLGLLALAVALVLAPSRPRWTPIGGAALVAVAVGGVWYLRNLLDHGSPLWPFVDLPLGDRIPESISSAGSFAESPRETLDGRVGDYLDELGAGALLLAAAIVVPLASRDRRLMAGGAAVALGLVLWMVAPATGAGETGDSGFFTATGTRYLLATVLLATAVLGAVASRGGLTGRVATATLGIAVIWGAVDFAVGRDGLPSPIVPLLGAGLGAAAGWFASQLPRLGPRAAAAAAVAACALVAVALAAYPGGWAERYQSGREVENVLNDTGTIYGELGLGFAGETDFEDTSAPVFFAFTVIGPIAGGGLDHDVNLIDPRWDCERLRAEAGDGWVVLQKGDIAAPGASCVEGTEPVFEASIPGGAALLAYRLGAG